MKPSCAHHYMSLLNCHSVEIRCSSFAFQRRSRGPVVGQVRETLKSLATGDPANRLRQRAN